MPLFDPDYCENRCPVCTKARKGNRLAKILQRIDWLITFGGCPWCRARQRKYGVRPDEPLPSPKDNSPLSPDSNSGPSSGAEKPPKLRWYQWRLRSLFVLTFLVAVGMSYVAVTMQNQRNERAAALELVKAGGTAQSEPTWLGSFLRDDSLVHVTDARITSDAAIAYLQRLPHLRSLSLDFTMVSDAWLLNLHGLTQLEVLSLTHTPVTDDGLAHLRRLTRLKHLGLFHTQVTDRGLASLLELKQLQQLDLGCTEVSDDGLAFLQKLTTIESLDLTSTKVTDRGLKHLKNLTVLTRLCLVGTRVTDEGLRDIQVLNSLKEVDLRLTDVSTNGAKKLQEALPICVIKCNGF